MGIIRLAKYHIVLFMVFSLLVLFSFYINEGGDMNTPGVLTAYYLISATLTYLPLLFILTVLNFIILSAGFVAFSAYASRGMVCFLPVLIFCLWFTLLGNDDAFRYYSLSNFQFSLILCIWSFLTIIGMVSYSGLRKYFPVAILHLFLFTLWFLLQKYNFTPSRLSLTDFQFKTILIIWTFLNCSIIMRWHLKKRQIINPIKDGEDKNINRPIRK